MKNKYLKSLFPVALILALTLSMLGTRNVLADDDTPPTPTEETPIETLPTEPPTTEEVPTEIPSTESSPAEEFPTETLPLEPSSTEEPATTPENTDETVPEIMEQIPDETTLIVLDENGEPLPLVSNEAADILVTGDPQWCPSGVTPGKDTLGQCTVAHSSFTDLINDLQANQGTYFGSGTIYVAYDYDATSAGDAGTDIIFNYGNGTSTVSLTDLVVQGGWDFASDTVVGTSTIDLGLSNSVEFWDWGGYGVSGSLTLNDLIITNSYGLYIGSYNDFATADVTLDNVEVTDTDYGTYIDTEGDVEITNSKFNNTTNSSGIMVYNGGDITISNVYANGNYGDGAVFDNSCGCTVGNIFISDSVFEFNGISSEGRGLIAHANGDITLKDVDASFNGGGGAELINCFFDFFGTSSACLNTNPAKITVTGMNTFQGNGYNPPQFLGSGPYASVGLWIGSNSDVSVDGTTVTGNGAGDLGGGAFIFTENGTLNITNSAFDDNCTTFYCDFLGFGLVTINLYGSGTTIDNITASGNGNGDGSTYNSSTGIGALVLNLSGNTFVNNSTFNDNCNTGTCFGGGGIMTLTTGNVNFGYVTASNNGISTGGGGGAMINAGGNVDIYCSTFSNQEVGLMVDIPTGSALTLNGVTFSGNTTDFIEPISGGTWTSNPFDCVPNPTPSKGGGTSNPTTSNLPLKVVNVGSGDGVELDCENYSGTKLVLENGDNLVVPCPLGGSASLTEQDSEGLPSALPSGVTFRSGFVSVVNESGSVNGKLSQSVLVSFVIPDGVDASSLAILFWDGAQWVEVKGTFVRNEDGVSYFEAYVDYVGTFVLAQK